MTTYCRNGHPVGLGTRVALMGGDPIRCELCGADLSEYVRHEPIALWPVVLAVFAALTVVGVWWWWLWFAPH